MIGVLAATRRPELFDRLVLVCPSPRYIDDEGYRGGFSKAEIDELLETMDGNYLGWSRYIWSAKSKAACCTMAANLKQSMKHKCCPQ